MNLYKILGIALIFLFGFLAANIIQFYVTNGIENPFKNVQFDITALNSKEAPHDFIEEKQIKVYEDRVVIYVKNASISSYADTGSMKPVLDENSNGIRIKPQSENEIHVGDIITFQEKDYLIVHRVIEKGTDKEGIYFVTKGDNNSVSDGKIRFKDIRYKTIGIIW
ncbi:MAG: signal peptidase I [Candidatus Pacearchaeota archaeon]|jgi:hypothetical protein